MKECLSSLLALEPLPGSVIADHAGPITGRLISDWGGLIRNSEDLSMNHRILLFGVFVEMIQNVAHHSARREGSSARTGGIGRISVAKQGNQYLIRTANPVDQRNASRIQEMASKLAGRNRLSLDSLFRKQINLRTEGNSGAGLGLIEIARRCSGSLETKINNIDPVGPILTVSAGVYLGETH